MCQETIWLGHRELDKALLHMHRYVNQFENQWLSSTTSKRQLPDRLVILHKKHNQLLGIKQMTAEHRGWWHIPVLQTTTASIALAAVYGASLVALLQPQLI